MWKYEETSIFGFFSWPDNSNITSNQSKKLKIIKCLEGNTDFLVMTIELISERYLTAKIILMQSLKSIGQL